MINPHKNPFSQWAFGAQPRCDYCGTYQGNQPPHTETCTWLKERKKMFREETDVIAEQLGKARKKALSILGITEEDLAKLKDR